MTTRIDKFSNCSNGNSQILRRKKVPQVFWGLGLMLVVTSFFLAPTASASHFQLSRLANQISISSELLASELRYQTGYGSVRIKADHLARESRQLVDSISRGRTDGVLRGKINDLARAYDELEREYLRVSNRRNNDLAYQGVSYINSLYVRLQDEYYYSSLAGNVSRGYRDQIYRNYDYRSPTVYQRYNNRSYSYRNNHINRADERTKGSKHRDNKQNRDHRTIQNVIGPRHQDSRHEDSRKEGQRKGDQRKEDQRKESPRKDDPGHGDRNDRNDQNDQNDHKGRQERQGHGSISQGRKSIGDANIRANNYDHRSPVLDRQNRGQGRTDSRASDRISERKKP